jgi:SOS response regulatory protein OraA/RecX
MAFYKKSKTKEPENTNKAYEYAVFLLSLQLRTVGEIRQKMEGRGYTSAVIENTIDELHRQKYLDDERYAEVFLDNLKQYKNLGYYGIKRKFMAKKLPSGIIGKILDEGLSVEDELKIAKRYLKKELPSGVILSPSASEDEESLTYVRRSFAGAQDDAEIAKQKIVAKLKSRGFRGEVIARLVF